MAANRRPGQTSFVLLWRPAAPANPPSYPFGGQAAAPANPPSYPFGNPGVQQVPPPPNPQQPGNPVTRRLSTFGRRLTVPH